MSRFDCIWTKIFPRQTVETQVRLLLKLSGQSLNFFPFCLQICNTVCDKTEGLVRGNNFTLLQSEKVKKRPNYLDKIFPGKQ